MKPEFCYYDPEKSIISSPGKKCWPWPLPRSLPLLTSASSHPPEPRPLPCPRPLPRTAGAPSPATAPRPRPLPQPATTTAPLSRLSIARATLCCIILCFIASSGRSDGMRNFWRWMASRICAVLRMRSSGFVKCWTTGRCCWLHTRSWWDACVHINIVTLDNNVLPGSTPVTVQQVHLRPSHKQALWVTRCGVEHTR